MKEFPSPADAAEVEGRRAAHQGRGHARAADPKAPLSAVVFKTISDPHVGKLSVFRVYSGTLRADSQVLQRHAATAASGSAISAGSRARPRSRSRRSGPGEIGVVAKLKDTLTGDTLCDEAHPVVLPGISFPEPAISFAIQPKTRGDEDKISTALHRMAEEDPTLHHHYDPETKQLLVSGMGQLHVEVVVERMKRKYNVDVSLAPAAHSLQGDGQGARRRCRASTRSRPAGAASTATPGSASSRSRAAAASSSSTTSSAARSRATSSPRWRRACATA